MNNSTADQPQDIYKSNLNLLRIILDDHGLKPRTNLEDMLSHMSYEQKKLALMLIADAIEQEKIVADKKTLDWWMDKLFKYISITIIKKLVSESSTLISTLKLFYKYDSSTSRSDFELRITQKLTGEDWETDEAKKAQTQLRLFWKLKAFVDGEVEEL